MNYVYNQGWYGGQYVPITKVLKELEEIEKTGTVGVVPPSEQIPGVTYDIPKFLNEKFEEIKAKNPTFPYGYIIGYIKDNITNNTLACPSGIPAQNVNISGSTRTVNTTGVLRRFILPNDIVYTTNFSHVVTDEMCIDVYIDGEVKKFVWLVFLSNGNSVNFKVVTDTYSFCIIKSQYTNGTSFRYCRFIRYVDLDGSILGDNLNLNLSWNGLTGCSVITVKSIDFRLITTGVQEFCNVNTEDFSCRNINISCDFSTRNSLNKLSLLSILNALNTTTLSLTLKFSPDCLAMLTPEEIAIGTSKGWTIS